MASLVVRLVPSAPFILVNMAAGLTPMRALDFCTPGTAIGIVPKIALTAFAGDAALSGLSGRGWDSRRFWLVLALAGLWIGSGLAARAWFWCRRKASGAQAPAAHCKGRE